MGNIYTLAQNGTAFHNENSRNTVLYGTGTPMFNNPSILKRANKKVITNALVLGMIDIAKANGQNSWEQRYWNTYHCQEFLKSYDNRYYSDYCKNRWCATCCGIRKAYLLNRYFPIINQWEEPHLLTLTLKTITANELNKRINEMISSFEKLKNRCNKRHLRGKGMKIMGVKSLECNFNATKKWYNPHYHIITPNRQIGLYIKQEWKKDWNKIGFNAGVLPEIKSAEEMVIWRTQELAIRNTQLCFKSTNFFGF